MTADPHPTERAPGTALSASLAASTPLVGASRRPDPGYGLQGAAQSFGGERTPDPRPLSDADLATQDAADHVLAQRIHHARPGVPLHHVHITLQALRALQSGPERPDAGTEAPDGTGGAQTATEPVARLRRLRTQLAAEHAKAVRAGQQPRPDLDHLRVTAPNGIAAGLETALFFVDHHLREAGEQPARTTANNGAASGDAADNSLRERIAAALREVLGCLYTLERVGGSVIGYQTVNVIPPALYDRWQAVLQAGGGEQP